MKDAGLQGSENPGISSDNPRENRGRRKSKVSTGRFVRGGLAGP